jgi:hypothetical protein
MGYVTDTTTDPVADADADAATDRVGASFTCGTYGGRGGTSTDDARRHEYGSGTTHEYFHSCPHRPHDDVDAAHRALGTTHYYAGNGGAFSSSLVVRSMEIDKRMYASTHSNIVQWSALSLPTIM